MNPTIAIVAQGAMGAGVGGRLVEKGLHVITSLSGRSEASAKRAKDAGMVPASDQECAQADYFLSIVPPSDALALAKKMSALIEPGNKKPIYVDCNAVSPPTKVEIGNAVTKSGAPFIDVGIIGLPPEPGKSPWLHASAPDAEKFCALGDFGINVNIMEGKGGFGAEDVRGNIARGLPRLLHCNPKHGHAADASEDPGPDARDRRAARPRHATSSGRGNPETHQGRETRHHRRVPHFQHGPAEGLCGFGAGISDAALIKVRPDA